MSFPNNTSLDTSKLGAFADDKLNLDVVEMMISVFHVAENIMGKGQNAGNQQYHLFPICFLPFHRKIVKIQP